MSAFEKVSHSGPIRVVIAGCGGIAQGWVERTVKKSGVEVVGLADVRREAAEQTAAKFQMPPAIVFSSLADALKQTQPDAVFDLTVPGAHREVTLAALKAGCHVLGEKPISDKLPDARKMCAAAEKAQRLYMVTQNRRYLPEIVAFSHAVRQQTLGALSSLDADFFIGAHFGGFRDEMAHVLLLDMAIHTFDAGRFISGCDPVAVYCREYNPKGSWYKGAAAAICVFEMTNDVVFTYRGSWAAAGFNTSWESNWRAVGTLGSAVWNGTDAAKAQVTAGDEGFIRPVKDLLLTPEPLAYAGHEGVLDEFLRCVRSGETPQTECHDNIKSLAMCFAAIESARTGKRIRIADNSKKITSETQRA